MSKQFTHCQIRVALRTEDMPSCSFDSREFMLIDDERITKEELRKAIIRQIDFVLEDVKLEK